MFGSIAFQFSAILELLVVGSRVDDFLEFVFLCSFYLNRRKVILDLKEELVALVRFEEGDVECVVNGH